MKEIEWMFRAVVLFIAGAGAAPAVAHGKDAAADAPTVRVKVDGAALRYAPLEIPRPKRTGRGELEMLERAAATLQVERPISSRRAQLPAGTYALTVEADEGKSYFLVVERSHRAATPSPRAPSSGSAEKKNKPAATRKAKSADVLEKKKRREAGTVEAPMVSSGGASVEPVPVPADVAGAGDSKGHPGGGARPTEASAAETPKAKAPAAFRAPLAISASEKKSDQVTFELKPAGKGSKLRVIVRSGGTEARATLKLGEATTE